MSIYKPNDTGCTAYIYQDPDLPPDTLQPSEYFTELTSDELNTISADNDEFVAANPGGVGYEGHRVDFAVSESVGDITELGFVLRGLGAWYEGGVFQYGWELFVWNADTSIWESKDSHTNSVDEMLIATISANISDYIDGSGNAYALVSSQWDGDFGEARLFYAELEVTAAAAAPAGFERPFVEPSQQSFPPPF